MKKKFIFKTLLILTVFAISLTSCKKEKEKDDENNYGKFTVTVKYNIDNSTVAGARVLLYGEEVNGNSHIKTQTTNSQGITVFDKLPPGTHYSFTADYDNHMGDTDDYELKAGENKHVTVFLN